MYIEKVINQYTVKRENGVIYQMSQLSPLVNFFLNLHMKVLV